jgi:uncharacterized protein
MLPPRLRLLKWYRGMLAPGQRSPLQIVMVQSTTFCNIDCSYCYLPFRERKGRFDLARLPALFGKLKESGLLGPQLTVIWHAGEPLVLPADYYREAFAIVKACVGDDCAVTHSFQTNGILLNDEFCRLFRESNARVGVSIDGPDFVHDKYRKSRAGAGTHAAAMRGIGILKAERIPFATISVVTADSLPYPDEIFDFLRVLGGNDMGFNVDELEGEHETSSLGAADSRERYTNFMQRILERSLTTPQAPPVREFRHAFESVQGGLFGKTVSSSESNPLSILSVGIDGRLVTYSPELLDMRHPRLGDLSFGTIEDVDFTTLFDNPRFARVDEEVRAGLALCSKSCGYFDVCGGGAPSNKLSENGTFASAETMFCRLKNQALVDITHDFLSRRLNETRRKPTPIEQAPGG